MTAILTIGIPASGKSTWAREYVQMNPDTAIVCRDDIRLAYGLKSGDNEQLVTKIHRIQMEAAFLAGMDIVVADTNINPKFRNQLIKFCHEHNVDVILKYFPISMDEAIMRDERRGNQTVGASVIVKFYGDLMGQDLSEFKKENGYEVWKFVPRPKNYNHDLDKPFAVVVDIDGTVARHVNRSPYDESKVGDDEPIQDVVNVICGLSNAGLPIVFASGRTDKCEADTRIWIENVFGYPFNYHLFMRKVGDTRPDWQVKADIYDEKILPHWNILMSFDDRDQVVRHVRARGITVAQVAPGRF